MNIIEMKKAVIGVMTMYENMVRKSVLDCIEEAMASLQDDDNHCEKNSYYVETLTTKQAMKASDEDFDESETQQSRIMATLKECKYELYKLLRPIDGFCKIDIYLHWDNTIDFTIEVDGMRFEFKYRNRYNRNK